MHVKGNRHVISQGRREQGMVMEGKWHIHMSVKGVGNGWVIVHGEKGRHTLQ